MSVRTNWIDAGFALINGAPTFMTLADGLRAAARGGDRAGRRAGAIVDRPAGALAAQHRYRAADFDTLVDSPILVGNPRSTSSPSTASALPGERRRGRRVRRRTRRQGSRGHRARAPAHVGLAAVRPVPLLQPPHRALGGGLEHKNSHGADGEPLGDADTRGLYLLAGAGESRVLPRLEREAAASGGARSVQLRERGARPAVSGLPKASPTTTPTCSCTAPACRRATSTSTRSQPRSRSCRRRPAAWCSRRSWRRSTRGSSTTGPTRTRANTSISYYTKGAVLGFLLDAKIRKATDGSAQPRRRDACGVPEVLRRRAATRPSEFRAVAEQVAGADLGDFWASAVTGHRELDYSEALDSVRPALPSGHRSAPRPGSASPRATTPAGCSSRRCAAITRRAAGLNVDDEILAIDDFRVARRPFRRPARSVQAGRQRSRHAGASRPAAGAGAHLRSRAGTPLAARGRSEAPEAAGSSARAGCSRIVVPVPWLPPSRSALRCPGQPRAHEVSFGASNPEPRVPSPESRASYTRTVRFDPEYVSQVLNENFEDAKTLFLSPLMAIHYAHLVMLAERGIVSGADGRRLREALDSISLDAIKCAAYDGTCEDLFFYVERLVTGACGDDTAGRLHTARSRNDIDMTMYRMRQREFIAAPDSRPALELRSVADRAGRAAPRHGVRGAHAHPAGAADDHRALPAGGHRAAGARRRAAAGGVRVDQSLPARRVCDHRHRLSDRP